MNLIKLSTLFISTVIIILLINGCATQKILQNKKTEIKPLGCSSKNDFPKSWYFDEDSLPVVAYKPSAIYLSLFKPILCIPFKNNQKLLLVEISDEYKEILEEIYSFHNNSTINSISVDMLNRKMIDGARYEYFVLNILSSNPIAIKSNNRRGGPRLYRNTDGSACYSFGICRSGWPFPISAKIEIIENHNFNSNDWISLFDNNSFNIDLHFHHTEQDRKYANSLTTRMLFTPFAFIFDVVTSPVQLFIGISALR